MNMQNPQNQPPIGNAPPLAVPSTRAQLMAAVSAAKNESTRLAAMKEVIHSESSELYKALYDDLVGTRLEYTSQREAVIKLRKEEQRLAIQGPNLQNPNELLNLRRELDIKAPHLDRLTDKLKAVSIYLTKLALIEKEHGAVPVSPTAAEEYLVIQETLEFMNDWWVFLDHALLGSNPNSLAEEAARIQEELNQNLDKIIDKIVVKKKASKWYGGVKRSSVAQELIAEASAEVTKALHNHNNARAISAKVDFDSWGEVKETDQKYEVVTGRLDGLRLVNRELALMQHVQKKKMILNCADCKLNYKEFVTCLKEGDATNGRYVAGVKEFNEGLAPNPAKLFRMELSTSHHWWLTQKIAKLLGMELSISQHGRWKRERVAFSFWLSKSVLQTGYLVGSSFGMMVMMLGVAIAFSRLLTPSMASGLGIQQGIGMLIATFGVLIYTGANRWRYSKPSAVASNSGIFFCWLVLKMFELLLLPALGVFLYTRYGDPVRLNTFERTGGSEFFPAALPPILQYLGMFFLARSILTAIEESLYEQKTPENWFNRLVFWSVLSGSVIGCLVASYLCYTNYWVLGSVIQKHLDNPASGETYESSLKHWVIVYGSQAVNWIERSLSEWTTKVQAVGAANNADITPEMINV